MVGVPRYGSEGTFHKPDTGVHVKVITSVRDSAGNIIDLSTLPSMSYDDRVRLITAFYPEYLQIIDEKVGGLLTSLSINDKNFSEDCKLAVRQRVESLIGDNTYSNDPVCSISGGDRLTHLLEGYGGYGSISRTNQYKMIESIQKTLTKISMEIAALCFYKAGYTEKGVYLVGLANADSVGIKI